MSAEVVLQISIHAPHTGRDGQGQRLMINDQYFNPRAPYGARLRIPQALCDEVLFQSTRPIRGATCSRGTQALWFFYFNPRAPYGARRSCSLMPPSARTFQSTRPIRGATGQLRDRCTTGRNFNPRAPYGARLNPYKLIFVFGKFQSTRPIRGATHGQHGAHTKQDISIHAPHTGRDNYQRDDNEG